MSDEDWEVQITVYHKGVRVKHGDSFGDTPSAALYAAHNDLELWAQDYDAKAAS